MAEGKFKAGDRVKWDSSGGQAEGKVVRVAHRSGTIKKCRRSLERVVFPFRECFHASGSSHCSGSPAIAKDRRWLNECCRRRRVPSLARPSSIAESLPAAASVLFHDRGCSFPFGWEWSCSFRASGSGSACVSASVARRCSR